MENGIDAKPRGGIVPPYLAYQTLQNFFSSLRSKGGVPSRIDRSILTQYSGAVQAQLLSALRYLGMVTPEGTPTSNLEGIVMLEEERRRNLWMRIIQQSYPYMFDDRFSLQSATSRQIEEKFAQVASGDTVRKCVSFFLLAAKEAGFAMSPYIKTVKARRGSANGAARSKRVSSPERPVNVPPEDLGGSVQSWSEMLLSKFPNFDPAWPDDVKAKWFESFEKLMKAGS